MKAVILCGGRGTRAYPHTLEVPKPLIEVAGAPVLDRLMAIYAAQGYTEFVLAAGYMADAIEAFAETCDPSWSVEVVDTGEATNTGGRVRRVAPHVGDEFFVTYADGLGNVDLDALVAAHRAHDGVATVTTIALPSPYGTMQIEDDGRVSRFREKPRIPEHQINAGFFVFDRAVFDVWPEPGEDLEREVLPALGAESLLYAYRHVGFWKSMDTYKDAVELGEYYAGDDSPWLATPGRSV